MARKPPPKKNNVKPTKPMAKAKPMAKTAKTKPRAKIPALGSGVVGLGGTGAQGMMP